MKKFSLLKTSEELTEWCEINNHSVIFVPTMGALHEGHKALFSDANKINSKKNYSILGSIFVNPLQFRKEEDFQKYPKKLEKDIEFAKGSGVQAIWAPNLEDIFPNGPESSFTLKAPKYLQDHLCGKERKGHFDGVATIISRFLSLIKPKILILGEKDWQQLIIIKNLIEDLNLPVEVRGVATVREKNGLALSSRNSYLSKKEINQALSLPKILTDSQSQHFSGKNLNLKEIRSKLEAEGLKVEYVEMVDPFLLQPSYSSKKIQLLAAAIKCGKTRLIDHRFLMNRKPIVAIDGPAGAGKSTVTKAFARNLSLLYLDTGAMYRAVTWLLNEKKVDPEDHKSVLLELSDLNIELQQSLEEPQKVLINGVEVSKEIRSPEVTKSVSTVAAQLPVREKLTAEQKKIGEKGGLVAEGRDIGTTVFPEADLKIFLTASVIERSKRRALDLESRGFEVPKLSDLQAQIIQRDKIDSTRDISPLLKAEDAIEVITDGMSIDEVVGRLTYLFRNKVPNEIWPTPY